MADLGSNVRQIVGGWTTNASKARYPNKPMGVWCSRIIADHHGGSRTYVARGV